MQTQPVLRSVERTADSDIIARTLAGDMRALEALMRLHNRTLYRTARAILRDDAEAQDVVQEAYLQAYRALGSFRGESKLSTWLVRITANVALMRRRREVRAALAIPIDRAADAAALGIPEATVRTRYFRARDLLRASMAGDIDMTLDDAFAFAGLRCDRIVGGVLAVLRRNDPS